jgi:DNA processing protein
MEDAEGQAERAARSGARIVSRWDEEYPTLLAATRDDPVVLYVQGAWALNLDASVAIVGTRTPTDDGAVITERVTAHFVDRRWSIVSGLALGCDAVAHRTALRAHGHTVAVLAHGLHTLAPRQHRALADDILDGGGAWVSEFPFGCEPRPPQFVKRDRTQAGLAQGTVLIQSDLTGGSLHAARAALDYDRWLAVAYPTARDRTRAEPTIRANLLVADGAAHEKARLLHCPADALERVIVVRSRGDYGHLTRDTPIPQVERAAAVYGSGSPFAAG